MADRYPAGWLSLAEGAQLRELAKTVPADQVTVELGAFKGRSTAFLAEGTAGKIYSVDSWAEENGKVQAMDVYLANRNLLPDPGRVAVLHTTTAMAGLTWPQDLSIGLLFIDAAHQYDAVLEDYDLWHQHIPSGGWIAFHDVSSSWPEVRKVVDTVVRPSGLWVDRGIVDSLWYARRK